MSKKKVLVCIKVKDINKMMIKTWKKNNNNSLKINISRCFYLINLTKKLLMQFINIFSSEVKLIIIRNKQILNKKCYNKKK